jgi:hypothetical protein
MTTCCAGPDYFIGFDKQGGGKPAEPPEQPCPTVGAVEKGIKRVKACLNLQELLGSSE